MANSVVLAGTITAGPVGSGDCAFPSGITNIVFGGNAVSAGVMFSSAASVSAPTPGSYVTLPGIGTAGPVTKANFLYVRTQTKMFLRLTMTPDSGPDIVSVVLVQGVLVLQIPDANYLKLLEAQGVGTVEYFASGNQ